MRRSKFPLLIALFGLLVMTLVYFPLQSTRADQTVYQINIATSPARGFLKATNLAPGDTVTSVLQVLNKGNLDFNYKISATRESGSNLLYNDLQITVADSDGLLYQGPMSGLQHVAIGTIAKGGKESLTVTAFLPKTVGNEAQRLTTSAAFTFSATVYDGNRVYCSKRSKWSEMACSRVR
ncbi:MAG: hypothetical protein ACXVC1_06205 [Tumebacillaceae bacterium]